MDVMDIIKQVYDCILDSEFIISWLNFQKFYQNKKIIKKISIKNQSYIIKYTLFQRE